MIPPLSRPASVGLPRGGTGEQRKEQMMPTPNQHPLFPLSAEQRQALSRELAALVVRYRMVEANKKAMAKTMTDELKALRGLMESKAQVLYDTDESAAKIDVDRLIAELQEEPDGDGE